MLIIIYILIITRPTAVAGVEFLPPFICVFVCFSARHLKNHLFWGQKVKGQGHESQKHCRRVSLHS